MQVSPQQIEEAKSILADNLAAIARWKQDLQNLSIEHLLDRPEAEGWSIGQVFVHLWMSGEKVFLQNSANAHISQENADREPKPFWPEMVKVGGFPPVQIKMPAEYDIAPDQPRSKEWLLGKLEALEAGMHKFVADYEKYGDEGGRVKHPIIGYLNSLEWFRLIGYHFNHHLNQRNRLMTKLGLAN